MKTAMSASGPKRTFLSHRRMSAFGGKADIDVKGFYSRFWPKADIPPWRKSKDLPRIKHRREPPEAGMQRRGESRQPVKGRRTLGRKAPKAPTKHVSAHRPPERFNRLKRERDEALEQLAATSEILHVIRTSPTDVHTVF